MAKILSIELGHSVIKLCEMDYKVKKPKIYQCQEAITPAGAVNDGYITEEKMSDLAYAIKETIARNGIKTKRVIFTVASAKIINREVTVPAVKENQIGSVVQANLSEYFPVSLADYEVTQSLIRTIADGPDAGKHRVLVFAAEKGMLNSYKRLAAACGLDIVNVCCSGASIIEAARGQKAEGCQAIIKMEEKYSIISVLQDGVLMLQRSINYGVGDAMSVVATQPGFAAPDTLAVWRLITRQNCTSEAVPNVKEAGRPEARAMVTDALNPLLSGIMRVFDYFTSHFDGVEIENVSIIGLGAQFIGVPEILGEALGIVCRKAGMFQDVDAYDSDVKQKSDAYFSCIGAGFAAEGFLHEDPKAGISKQTNYVGAAVLVGIFCAVVAVALAVMAILPYKQEQETEQNLQSLYTTYEQGLVAYNKYQATRTLYEQVALGQSMSQHANDNLLVFLGELEEKMPYDVVIEEFGSDDSQCVINMTVADKGTAAKVIDTMRTFDSVMYVYVEEINEVEYIPEDFEIPEETEGVLMPEITVINFTVNCVYYPIEPDMGVGMVQGVAAPAGQEG
ncbi:MAG: pilus assembly protein PilM [Clostridium sp.]|nr:pilus assembly protein PilM [Acetatifactor muris]MCM1526031.1 pilus assembly protein PilM [Bacteroides sp.]MCM1562209.1 pilus assembly protein PilM [Clostridium sp.]